MTQYNQTQKERDNWERKQMYLDLKRQAHNVKINIKHHPRDVDLGFETGPVHEYTQKEQDFQNDQKALLRYLESSGKLYDIEHERDRKQERRVYDAQYEYDKLYKIEPDVYKKETWTKPQQYIEGYNYEPSTDE